MFRCILYSLALVTPLVWISCSIPEMPGKVEWDLHATVPFSARTYYLSDLVDSPSTIHERGWGIGMDVDSVLFFTALDSIETTLQDSLRLDPYSRTIERPIDAIYLPVEDTMVADLSLLVLNPDLAALHGQTLPNLEPHSLAGQFLVSFGEGVDSFEVDSGSITFRIENEFAYDVEALSLTAHNHRGQSRMLAEDISIPARASVAVSASIDGLTSASTLDVELTATGVGGTNITVDSTRGINVESSLSTLLTSPYYGIIRPQVLERDTAFTLDQRHRLFQGIIRLATLRITAINESQVDDSVWIEFPNLETPDGNILTSAHFVRAGSRSFSETNLQGYVLRLPDTDPQLFESRLRTRSVESVNHLAFHGGVEYVEGEIEVSDIYFEYFDGVLNDLEIELEEDGQSVERPPDGWEGVHPTEATLSLKIHTPVSVAANLELVITSYLRGTVIDAAPVELNSVILGQDSVFILDGFASLLGDYPDSVAYSGRALAYGAAIAFETDSISMAFELIAPLAFTLDTVNRHGDVEKIDFDGIEDIQSAAATVRIWNRLPLGGTVSVFAATDSGGAAWNPDQLQDPVAVVSVPVAPIESGRAQEVAYSEHHVSATISLIDLLRNPPFFGRTDILLPALPGDTLIAYGGDYIRVQVILNVDYRVGTGDY